MPLSAVAGRGKCENSRNTRGGTAEHKAPRWVLVLERSAKDDGDAAIGVDPVVALLDQQVLRRRDIEDGPRLADIGGLQADLVLVVDRIEDRAVELAVGF